MVAPTVGALGETKNDKIDSEKIAKLIRGGNFPLAYVYPREQRAVRDLLRRRMYLVRARGECQAHIQLTNYQYNLPAFEKKLDRKNNRTNVAERFTDVDVRKNVEVDLSIMDHLTEQIKALEYYIIRHAKKVDPRTFFRLRSVPGIDEILAMVLLYEVQDIKRFPTVQSFCTYARLVKCPKESAGQRYGFSGAKIGNAHLKWAFSEATLLFMRESDRAKKFVAQYEKKHGKGKAISILTHKLGRAVYAAQGCASVARGQESVATTLWKGNDAFDEKYFFANIKL